jgi:hypothetical protein
MFRKPLWQIQFELWQENQLVSGWRLYTPQLYLFVISSWQNHVCKFNLRKFPKDLPWLISKTRLAKEWPQRFPDHLS